jgi:hypothetical protein
VAQRIGYRAKHLGQLILSANSSFNLFLSRSARASPHFTHQRIEFLTPFAFSAQVGGYSRLFFGTKGRNRTEHVHFEDRLKTLLDRRHVFLSSHDEDYSGHSVCGSIKARQGMARVRV